MLDNLREAIMLKEEQEFEENILNEMIENLPEDDELEEYILSGECEINNMMEDDSEDSEIFDENFSYFDLMTDF